MLAHVPAILLSAMTLVFAHCGVNMIILEPDHDDKVSLVWAMLAPLLSLFGACLSLSFERWLESHRGVEVLVV